jgi:hypothetical protein
VCLEFFERVHEPAVMPVYRCIRDVFAACVAYLLQEFQEPDGAAKDSSLERGTPFRMSWSGPDLGKLEVEHR